MDSRYVRPQRFMEASAIAVFAVLAISLLPRMIDAVAAEPVVVTAAALLVGLVGADFVSGIVHWLGDTFGEPSWPIVGQTLIRGFREHHVDPQAITHHDFVETNGSVAVGLIPVLVLCLALPAETTGFRRALLVLGSFAASLFATNQIHKWAHLGRPTVLVRVLQRFRLILAQETHAVHHRPPFDRSYCITTGWLNAPLAAIEFFPRLEALIAPRARPPIVDGGGGDSGRRARSRISTTRPTSSA